MMDQDRITQYIHSLDQGHGAFCDRIAKDARAGRVPIIRKETASFLQAMVAAKQPEHILEVGTAVGYSAPVSYTHLIGVAQKLLDSTIRISFGIFNTKEEVDYTIDVLKELVPVLRRYQRG